MSQLSGLEIRSLIAADGKLKLWLEDQPVRAPAGDEIVVRIDAAPLNPSDIIQLLGPVDPQTLIAVGTPDRPEIHGAIPADRMTAIAGRLDRVQFVGNEGAGVVVDAGTDVAEFLGKTVAVRSVYGTYCQYQIVKAADCLVLPEGMSAETGAAAFINPLTALGMVETMRREGHSAIVHTAAASNLGQMLNRLCRKDGIPLVNIVRSQDQVTLLEKQGARHVLDSSAVDFQDQLIAALGATGATLAFDAIGGGGLAGTILDAMEQVVARRLSAYSRYGSPVHKQVYIYGVLDPRPRVLDGNFGMAWGVGGWLMTWFYDRIGAVDAQRLRSRVADELDTTFASQFSAEIGLAEVLSLDGIRAYAKRATGEKYLVKPQANFA